MLMCFRAEIFVISDLKHNKFDRFCQNHTQLHIKIVNAIATLQTKMRQIIN